LIRSELEEHMMKRSLTLEQVMSFKIMMMSLDISLIRMMKIQEMKTWIFLLMWGKLKNLLQI